MRRRNLHARLTVAETLRRWPQATRVFLTHRMACPGCVMARFDTLADVAAIYGLTTSRFLGEIAEQLKKGEALMSTVSEMIRAHHAELIDSLHRQASALADRRPDADAAAFAAFLQKELLPHAVGEERHLYPAVDPLIKTHGVATATMSVDHEYIEEYIRQIAAAAQAPAAEQAAVAERLGRLALRLEALLEVHLAKEERVYLPLFEQYLSEDQQQAVLDGMHAAY